MSFSVKPLNQTTGQYPTFDSFSIFTDSVRPYSFLKENNILEEFQSEHATALKLHSLKNQWPQTKFCYWTRRSNNETLINHLDWLVGWTGSKHTLNIWSLRNMTSVIGIHNVAVLVNYYSQSIWCILGHHQGTRYMSPLLYRWHTTVYLWRELKTPSPPVLPILQ